MCRFLNVFVEGDSTAFLGTLFQCMVTTVKFFLTFRQNLLRISFCPLLHVLLLGATEKSLNPSS